jgi:hypothetical protein
VQVFHSIHSFLHHEVEESFVMSRLHDRLARKAQKNAFHLNDLDKEVMRACLEHPKQGLSLWMMGYFDGIALPYQNYFEWAPQKDKLLIAGIRTGKSELVSISALKFCQFHSGSRFLNTSISSEQAKIVYQNCLKYCYQPKFQHWVDSIQSSPYPTIKLVNGSELWFRSIGYEAELIRGFEFDFINIDEAAYVIRERAITTLKGRLLGINSYTHEPRAGWFWMVSSPKGRGWLYERWKLGDPAYPALARPDKYLSLRATTFDNPLLSKEQLQDTIDDMSESMRQQELYGVFLQDSDVLFPYELVMEGCAPDDSIVRELYRQISIWNTRHMPSKTPLVWTPTTSTIALPPGYLEKITQDIEHYECEPIPGHLYVAGWDPGKKATTKGRNACVGIAYDITHEPWRQVAYLYSERLNYIEFKAKMEEWHAKYSSNGAKCLTIFDATGKGDVVKELIDQERSIDNIEGITFTGQNKPYLLQAGSIVIERHLARFPFIKRFVDQLTQYTPDDEQIAQDAVMAFCLMAYRARQYLRQVKDPADKPVILSNIVSGDQNQSSYTNYSGGYRSAQSRHNPRYVQSRLASRAMRQHIYNGRRHGGNGRASA